MGFCSECKGILQTNSSNGDITCRDCGLVDSTSFVLVQPRIINKNGDEWADRTDGPFNYLFRPISTATKIFIKKDNVRDKDLLRIFRWHRITNTKDKTMQIIITDVERIFRELNIPMIIQQECVKHFLTLIKSKKFKSSHRTYNSYFAAAIYFFGKQHKYFYSIRNLKEKFDCEISHINFSIRTLNNTPHKRRVIDFQSLILRYCDTFELDSDVRSSAINLFEKYSKKYEISGKNPLGVAGAIIIFTCNRLNVPIQRKMFVKQINITQVTIRNRIVELESTNRKFRIFDELESKQEQI